eukprot:11063467-Karenia_brevis.AAC.1
MPILFRFWRRFFGGPRGRGRKETVAHSDAGTDMGLDMDEVTVRVMHDFHLPAQLPLRQGLIPIMNMSRVMCQKPRVVTMMPIMGGVPRMGNNAHGLM